MSGRSEQFSVVALVTGSRVMMRVALTRIGRWLTDDLSLPDHLRLPWDLRTRTSRRSIIVSLARTDQS